MPVVAEADKEKFWDTVYHLTPLPYADKVAGYIREKVFHNEKF